MSKSFIERVQSQLIFDSPIGTINPKLASRKDTELFCATNNVIRFCTINDKTTNYKIIVHDHSQFQIEELLLNDLGNLLAVIGSKDVVICVLPSDLSAIAKEVSLIKVKSYKLNFGPDINRIKKCLWQPSVSTDSNFVFLTADNKIKCFDVNVSTEAPQLCIDLAKEESFGDKEIAGSIAFGGASHQDTNLAGCLTLYVISLSGKVYSIYPFLYKSSAILASEKQIKELYHTTAVILEKLSSNEENGSPFGEQLRFVKALFKQIYNPITPRKIGNKFVINNQTTDAACLQGPIFNSNSIANHVDICSFSDSYFPVLATSIGKDKENTIVSIFLQLKPLYMKWKSNNETNVNSKAIIKPVTGYKKPIRGFGFIDESDEEAEESGIFHTPSKLTMISSLKIENYFSADLFKIPYEPNKFGLRIHKKGIYIINIKEVIKKILKTSKLPESGEIKYEKLPKSTSQISGFTILKDTITEEGTFLVYFSRKDGVQMSKISEGLTLEKATKPKPKEIAEKKSSDIKSTLAISPFEEVKLELINLQAKLSKNSLKKTTSEVAAKLNVPLDSKIIPTDPKYLSVINTLSLNTIQYVSAYTQFAINLKLRLSNQLDNLKSSLDRLNEIKNSLELPIDPEIDVKIEKLTTRQEKINERLTSLNQRIFDAIQTLKLETKLPISKEETKWFKELNDSTALVGGDLKKSFMEQKKQVSKLKEELSVAGLTLELNALKLNQKIAKVKGWLEQEGQLIQISMIRLEQIANQTKLLS